MNSPLTIPRELAAGRFRVLHALGQGGMGTVLEAFDRTRDEHVAVKLLNRLDAAGIYHLKCEFRSLAETRHRNLIRLHELFADENAWFFSMELIRGVPFDRWVRPAGVLDLERLRDALSQLCGAVSTLHSTGKLHRDLKPSNVLVEADGRVVVLDFGLVVDQNLGVGETISSPGICGTPAYMAPEQAAGRRGSAASDTYAIGVMLYEALTGRLPFEGSLIEILFAKQSHAPAPPSASAENVPRDLDALCCELLEISQDRRPDSRAVAARTQNAPAAEIPRPAVQPRLVGRDAELATLRSSYEASLNEQPSLVVVSGASGIGKTALLDAFVSELAPTSVVVLRARCYERERLPFKAFDPLIDALARYVRGLAPQLAAASLPREVFALAKLFPALERLELVTAMPSKPVADPQELRRRAFSALAEWLMRLRDRQPVLVIVDDLHWACPDSLLGLRELLLVRPAAPILLVLSHRECAGLEQVLAAASESGMWKSRTVPLGPLGVAATRTLIAQSAQLPAETTAALAEESRGHPFLARELARFGMRETGPATLASLIASRYLACSESARAMLEMLALVGEPLALGVLLDAAQATSSDIDHLRAADLLRATASASETGDRVECYHDLVAEHLVRALSPRRTRLLSSRLSKSLTQRQDAEPELLSRCLALAGDSAAAAKQAVLAAQNAQRACAFERAAELFGNAIELGILDPHEHVECLRSQAICLGAAGHSARSAGLFLRAAILSEGSAQIELKRRAADQLLFSGHIGDGMPLLREIHRSVGLGGLGAVSRWSDQRLGLAVQTPRDEKHARLQLRVAHSSAVAQLCFHPRGLLAHELYLDLATKSGHSWHRVRALGYYLIALTGNAAQADARGELTRQFRAAALDIPDNEGFRWLVEGMVDYQESRFRQAQQHLAQASAHARAHSRHREAIDVAQIFHLMAAAAAGDLPCLLVSATELLAEAQRYDRTMTVTMLCAGTRALAWLTPDDAVTYRKLHAETHERWKHARDHHAPTELYGSDLRWSSQLAADQSKLFELYRELPPRRPERTNLDLELFLGELLLDLYSGRTEIAYRSILQRAPNYADLTAPGRRDQLGYFALPWLAIYRGQCLASLLRDSADPSFTAELQSDLATVIEVLQAHDCPTARALALMFQAALALHQQSPERCVGQLRRAVEACDAVGLALYAAAARRRLGQHIGGDEGQQLVRAAETWMLDQGVKNLDAMTESHCAGLRV